MQWPNEKGQNDQQWSTKNYTENLTILRNKTDVYKPYRHVPWCSLYMFIKGVHDVWLQMINSGLQKTTQKTED
jgi:hypothetical protein